MSKTPRSTLLQRFRRDASGNVLAIMAASLLPMMAAVSAAIDMSRNYMVKSRLQQACDAGVLAGRKLQGAGTYAAVASDANEYFRINFPTSLYGAQNINFTSSSTDNKVANGTAAAFVPATISKFMGYAGANLSVTCSARLDLSDTDIMFVLDTTGSMNCSSVAGTSCPNVDNNGIEWGASSSSPSTSEKLNDRSRIGALRTAVINFTNTLNGAASATTQIRYGFVPYSGSVNVGRLLGSGWINDTSEYASRTLREEHIVATSTTTNGTTTYSCPSGYSRNGQDCSRVVATYENRSLDVSRYKTFQATTTPTFLDGRTSTWDGCIQERSTVANATFWPVPAGALDLDMDLPATSTASRWTPLWPEVSYYRAAYTTSATSGGQFQGPCPSQAQLTAVPATTTTTTAKTTRDYVLGLSTGGATYHDIGMIWGLRLLSPNGPWASNNAPRPGSTRVRHIIFMTDGDMKPWDNFIGAYGIERHMNRVGGGQLAQAELINRHNARFLAACRLARDNYSIKVWAVAFGEQLSNTKLTECAGTSSRAFQADNADQLNTAFQQIATQIADLRLSQ